MSQNADERRAESVARFDPPHSPDAGQSTFDYPYVAADALVAAAGQSAPLAAEQLRLQAGQLASHLRVRMLDLDQRESHLNARVAQLESESRTSRLWFREREQEFAEREAAWQRELVELRARLQMTAAADVSAEDARQRLERELLCRDAELADRERRLAEGQSRLADETQKLSEARDLIERWPERERQMERLSSWLQSGLQELERQRDELARDRDRIQQEARERQRLIAEAQSRFAREQAEAKQLFAARHEQQKQREAVLEQLRGEVFELHQRALETRLILEELWMHCQKTPAPERAAVIGELRAELAEHYRLAEVDLQEKAAAVRTLTDKLRIRRESLQQQRAQGETWLRSQREALDDKEAQLAASSADLEQRERRLDALQHEWLTQGQELLSAICPLRSDASASSACHA